MRAAREQQCVAGDNTLDDSRRAQHVAECHLPPDVRIEHARTRQLQGIFIDLTVIRQALSSTLDLLLGRDDRLRALDERSAELRRDSRHFANESRRLAYGSMMARALRNVCRLLTCDCLCADVADIVLLRTTSRAERLIAERRETL